MGSHRVVAFTVVLLVPAAASAQVAERPGVTRALTEDERIVALLRSSDARDQAWGAWYANRDRRDDMLPLLEQIVASRIGAVAPAEAAAFDIAVDALIQMGTSVPAELLPLIYQHRPAQALILAALERAESTAFLFEIFKRERGEAWFAAANLLLPFPPDGYAAALLRDLRVTARVYVTDGEGGGFGGSGGAGGSSACGGGANATAGLPPWPSYTLTLHAQPGLVVQSMGPHPVYYQRTVGRARLPPNASRATTGEGPSSTQRLDYIARLLSIKPAELPVRAVEYQIVRWSDTRGLEQELARIRRDIAQRLEIVTYGLRERGYLGAQESALSPDPIQIVVEDARSDRTTPLDAGKHGQSLNRVPLRESASPVGSDLDFCMIGSGFSRRWPAVARENQDLTPCSRSLALPRENQDLTPFREAWPFRAKIKI